MTKDKVTALSSLFRYYKTIDYYIRSQYQDMRAAAEVRSGQVTESDKLRGPRNLVLTSYVVINCFIILN